MLSIIVGALIILSVVFLVIVLPLWIGGGDYSNGISVIVVLLAFIVFSWMIGELILNPSMFN